jgi:DNA-binding SARP family transcriptional activator
MDNQQHDGVILRPQVQVRLLGGFGVTIDARRIALPLSAQRVLVAMAIRPQEQDRTALGEMLYPDGRRKQAMASLRSALWRARRDAGHAFVETRGQRLRLDDCVEVDLRTWMDNARVVTSRPPVEPSPDFSEWVEALSQELLPSWSEEWLVLERQRWDLFRLHALERLAEQFAADGRSMEALEAGLAAVAIEPYRESAHRAIISAHIAEGNSASALAQYHRCQRLLTRDLGVRPTTQLQELIQGLTSE